VSELPRSNLPVVIWIQEYKKKLKNSKYLLKSVELYKRFMIFLTKSIVSYYNVGGIFKIGSFFSECPKFDFTQPIKN